MKKNTRILNIFREQLKKINFFRSKDITALDMAIFFRQFSTLNSAGLGITQTFEILEKSQSKNTLRLLIFKIKREILNGKNLFYTLKSYPKYFDELTCHLIHIGENTGKLDKTLLMVANYLEKKLCFQNKIRRALFYPTIIIFFALIITFAMFYFIVPSFAELFKNHLEKLPQITRLLFYLSNKLHAINFSVLLCFLLALVILFRTHRKFISSFFKFYFAELPLIKKNLHKIVLAKFSRYLALTLEAGLPITQALVLAAQPCQNQEFLKIILELRHKLNSGFQLNDALATFPFFPILMIQMIKTGEEAGKLEYMLNTIADFFETEIEQLINSLSQLLEPLIMLVLGVLIGGLVLSLYLPIFKLGSVL